jgi:hypothetical protein
MIADSGGCLGRSIVPILLAALIGCGSTANEHASGVDVERPIDALQALAAADPLLGAKLELDPSVKGTWWTSPGRWDDPSRRIKVQWDFPLSLIVYPSSLLQLPGALIDLPASILDAILHPKDTATKELFQRLGEEAAERHYPSNERPPR